MTIPFGIVRSSILGMSTRYVAEAGDRQALADVLRISAEELRSNERVRLALRTRIDLMRGTAERLIALRAYAAKTGEVINGTN